LKSTTNTLSLGALLQLSAAQEAKISFMRCGADAPAPLNSAELEQRADRHHKLWLAAGLSEGARVAMIATPEPETLAAIVGATRAGVEVVLLSPALSAPEIAASLGLTRASALTGPAEFAGVDFARRLSEARAAAGAVSWLMLWEVDRPRLFRPDNMQGNAPVSAADRSEAGLAVANETGAQPLSNLGLRARAGDFIEALGVRRNDTIVSLVSPATPAGLVVSAHAPLVAGASLVWQAPFSATALERALAEAGSAHLVAPAAIADELARSELLASSQLATLTLIVAETARLPLFEADIDDERVFFLQAQLSGPTPLTRLAPELDASGAELR